MLVLKKMMLLGFGLEYIRSNDGGSYGLGGLWFFYREVLCMEVIVLGVCGVYNGGYGFLFYDENYNGWF